MPIVVSVTKESGNLENPGMFSPSTRTIHLAVDYCDVAAANKRTSVQEVTYDMMNEGWAIAVGRPLGMPIVPATSPATYNSSLAIPQTGPTQNPQRSRSLFNLYLASWIDLPTRFGESELLSL